MPGVSPPSRPGGSLARCRADSRNVPTYDYQCRQCGTTYEIVHSMLEDGPTTCERCGGQLRRVLYPSGIIFKGSGFYKTDSRSGSSSASRSGATSTSKEGSGAGDAATGGSARGDAPKGDTAKAGGTTTGPGSDSLPASKKAE